MAITGVTGSILRWCERELDTPRSSVSREDWNGKVLERLKEGLLAPGCEEDDTVDCRTDSKDLKSYIINLAARDGLQD